MREGYQPFWLFPETVQGNSPLSGTDSPQSTDSDSPQYTEDTMTSTNNTFGTLHNYHTGDAIRPATRDELLESREAANTDGGAGVIEVGGISCYVEGGDDFIAATDYLYDVEEEVWQRTCGNQSREEFATFTIEQGQAIEDAWAEALAHAESL